MKAGFGSGIVVLPLVALLAGCATGVIGSLDYVHDIAGASPAGPRPSAYVEVSATGVSPSPHFCCNKLDATAYGEIVKRVTEESALFDKYSFDATRARETHYRLNLSLNCERKSDTSFWWDFHSVISMCTLFLLPGPITNPIHCTLSSTITGRNGEALKSYKIEQVVEHYMYGLYAVPLAIFSHGEDGVLENQVRVLYRRMRDDGVFVPVP